MKKLDKVILTLFSVIIFLQAVLVICMVVGWVKIATISKFAEIAIAQDTTSKAILVFAIVCLICAIKCIFFDSSSKEKETQGILMQNDNGKLLISKPTLESLVISVVKDFDSVSDTNVKIDLDELNNVMVNVNLVVSKNVIIKELTLNMQNKIKDAIKRTSDLEVKEVNIKIKNIEKQDESSKK